MCFLTCTENAQNKATQPLIAYALKRNHQEEIWCVKLYALIGDPHFGRWRPLEIPEKSASACSQKGYLCQVKRHLQI